MTRKKLLVISLAGLAALGVVAYVVIAQVISYTPEGRIITVASGTVAEISFPHWRPFFVVMGELWAASEATGFVMATENDCWISWVGMNGDGTVTKGNAAMGTGMTILRVGAVELKLNPRCTHRHPLTEEGQPGHTLIVDATRSKEGVRVTLIK